MVVERAPIEVQEIEKIPNRYAVLLAGQGSTVVGLGEEEYKRSQAARKIFEQADSLLVSKWGEYSLKAMCFEGPQEDLSQTINTHLANTTAMVAKYEALREKRPSLPLPEFVAPQSSGECGALAIAGVMDFESALLVAQKRGEITDRVGKQNPGSMASILDIKGGEERLQEICNSVRNEFGGVVGISNINSSREHLISGETLLVDTVLERIDNARKKVKLSISFASHCELMEPARVEFGKFLEDMEFQDPIIPVVMNGDIITKGDDLRRRMSQGLIQGVNWQKTVERMEREGVQAFVELTPNPDKRPVVGKFARNITPDMPVIAL